MASRDASDIIHRNDYQTRYINYTKKKNNTIGAIVNILGGSAGANDASEVIYITIGGTLLADSNIDTDRLILVSSVYTVYYNPAKVPLATVATDDGVFMIDGSSNLFNVSLETSVSLPYPITAIATDFSNNIYVTTSSNVYSYLYDSNAFVSMNITGLTNISALTVGSNFYFLQAGSSQIFQASQNGAATVIAGSTPGFAEGNGSIAQFNRPKGIALDPTGQYLYVAETGDSLIRMISTVFPYTVSTVAGNPIGFYSPFPTDDVGNRDGSIVDNDTLMYYPEGVTVTQSGLVFIADTNNNTIRSLNNGVLSTISGQPGEPPIYDVSPIGFTNSITAKSLWNSPSHISAYKGSLYVTEPLNNAIRIITLVY
jgi:hypothetical protein